MEIFKEYIKALERKNTATSDEERLKTQVVELIKEPTTITYKGEQVTFSVEERTLKILKGEGVDIIKREAPVDIIKFILFTSEVVDIERVKMYIEEGRLQPEILDKLYSTLTEKKLIISVNKFHK